MFQQPTQVKNISCWLFTVYIMQEMLATLTCKGLDLMKHWLQMVIKHMHN